MKVIYTYELEVNLTLPPNEYSNACRELNIYHTGRESFPLEETPPDLLDRCHQVMARGNVVKIKVSVCSNGEHRIF